MPKVFLWFKFSERQPFEIFNLHFFVLGDYAIVVNTNHASVKSQFTQAFSNASQYVDTGWKFCIEVNGNSFILEVYIL